MCILTVVPYLLYLHGALAKYFIIACIWYGTSDQTHIITIACNSRGAMMHNYVTSKSVSAHIISVALTITNSTQYDSNDIL